MRWDAYLKMDWRYGFHERSLHTVNPNSEITSRSDTLEADIWRHGFWDLSLERLWRRPSVFEELKETSHRWPHSSTHWKSRLRVSHIFSSCLKGFKVVSNLVERSAATNFVRVENFCARLCICSIKLCSLCEDFNRLIYRTLKETW